MAELVEGLRVHVDDLAAALAACQAMAHLTDRPSKIEDLKDPEKAAAIVKAGGIEAVLAAGKKHSGSAQVAEQVWRVLTSLAYDSSLGGGSDDRMAAIAAAGGIEALVRVLGGRPVIEEISSFFDFFAIMVGHKEEQKPVKIGEDDDGNACQALANACLALRQLAGLADNQARIAAAGGVGALVRILQHQAKAAVKEEEDEESHEEDDMIEDDDNEAKEDEDEESHEEDDMIEDDDDKESRTDMIEQVCGALASLAGLVDARDRFGAEFSALLRVLREHHANGAVMKQACGALASLAGFSSNHQVRIAQSGGIEEVLRVLGEHPANAAVMEQACRALSNIVCSDQKLQKRMKDAGAEPLVRAAVAGPDATDATKEMGQKLLAKMMVCVCVCLYLCMLLMYM